MKLTLELHRETSTYQYGSHKTEVVKAADIDIEGDAQLVAETLRALADTISPALSLPMSIGVSEYDGESIYRALKTYKRQRGLS